MKRKLVIFSVILVMVVQLLMTGCAGTGKGAVNGNGSDKAKGTELQIGIVAKGYGSEYVKEMAKAFEKKTGTKVSIVKAVADASWVGPTLQAGAQNNDMDIIIDIRPDAMKDLAASNYLAGYERAYVDLSDIYDSTLEGYKEQKTLEELVDPYILSSCTWDLEKEGFGDGKQYFISYATGMEGLVYNADLFEKYNLKEPKTTTEFFALCEKIKTMNGGKYPKNKDGREIYPFTYSGKVDYCSFLTGVWMAQYDGMEAYSLALQGKDAQGLYTAKSLKTEGKLSAYEHISKLISQKNGYVKTTDFSQSFTNAQLYFLDEQAFMMVTGDWLEQEMSSNSVAKGKDIRFMRTPVNSDIVLKCDSVKTEAQLVEVISYIDGEVAERPAYLSEADLARITEARSLYHCEGNQHIAYIPAYSNMIEEGKAFLQYMLSKEGQEIMLKYCHGNMAPLNVDVTQMDFYDELSALQKSRYDMINSEIGVTWIGKSKAYPMSYVGGITLIGGGEASFGVVDTSSSYKTPKQLWDEDYEEYASNWQSLMKKANVSN